MTNNRFNEIAKEQLDRLEKLLIKKGNEYALTDDRLVNFKEGAAISHWPPEKVLFGYMLKHLTSLTTMINSDEKFTRDLWQEKLGDIMAYCILLLAVLEDDKMFLDDDKMFENK